MNTPRSNIRRSTRQPDRPRAKTPPAARRFSRPSRRRHESALSIYLPIGVVLSCLILGLVAWVRRETPPAVRQEIASAPTVDAPEPTMRREETPRVPIASEGPLDRDSSAASLAAAPRVAVEPEPAPIVVPLTAPSAATPPTAEREPVRVPAAIDAMLSRAEEAARRRGYRAAADEARRILDSLAADDVSRPVVEPRAHDLIDLARLFADFLAAIPGMSDRSWPIARDLVGTIEGATEEHLDVRVGAARSGVAWADVPAERMLDLFRRVGARDAYALAAFCFDNGLEVEGSRELHSFVERAPEQAPRAYGLVARERGVAVPDDGFVFHEDRWLTHEEQNLAALKTTIRSLAERIREGSGEEAASAAREIEDVLARPEPSPGFAQEARTLRVSSLEARHEALIERLGRLPAMAAIERMKSLKRELNAARAEAMRVIFDKGIYPDEDHGRRGQPAVDKRVRQVRELWERPATTLPGSPKPIRDMLASLLDLEGLMGQYGGTGRRDGEWMRLLAMIDRPVDVRTVTLDDREQEVLDYNRRVQESNAAQKSAMTSDERQVVELVNEYREMMGLRILEFDDLLTTAARGHSEDMEARGFFAHENPDGKGPGDRCREAGYPRAAVGENIVMGAYHAKEAHESWYGSSGHHRNMLNGDWTQMGCGRSGGHWTENFGAAPPKPK